MRLTLGISVHPWRMRSMDCAEGSPNLAILKGNLERGQLGCLDVTVARKAPEAQIGERGPNAVLGMLHGVLEHVLVDVARAEDLVAHKADPVLAVVAADFARAHLDLGLEASEARDVGAVPLGLDSEHPRWIERRDGSGGCVRACVLVHGVDRRKQRQVVALGALRDLPCAGLGA